MESTGLSPPKIPFVFGFEETFAVRHHRQWMHDNWHVCFYWIGAYMLLVFGGQHYMQSRRRFELRYLLAAWNLFLAVFSVMGTIRSVQEFAFTLSKFGLHHSCCSITESYMESNPALALWSYLFTLSKVPELGDTVFIVLRKQPLIFLHWYHHVTVLIFTWFSYSDYISTARWFVVMNYSVHSLMYTYYMFKALRFKVPRWVSIVITMAQLSQMVVGCAVNGYAYHVISNGGHCDVSMLNIKLALLMYFSYFVLFAHFFHRSYIQQRRPIARSREYKLE